VSPISDVPLSSTQAPPRRFQNRQEAGATCPLRSLPRVDLRDQDHHTRRALRTVERTDRDAFRRATKDRVTPVTTPVLAFLLENVARARAPFSPRSRRSVRQHVERKPPRLAPRRSSRLAAPRPSRRAMRRTDFCHFTSFVPVPAPRRFSVHRTLARPRDRGDRLIRRQCDSLRWVARSLAGVVAPGVVLLS